MMKLLLILFLSLSVQAFAGVINQTATHFKTTGSIQSFQWAPERYNSDFRYDVVYYIPESLKEAQNVKTLIFMHGGGSSTMDRAGSLKTVMIYMSDMVRLANETQSIVVMPSANGLNWGGHTVGMIRDLNQLMRKELDVDHNNMGLGGHSMGGMGIGRSYQWLADEFSYFLPTAAGIDPRNQAEVNTSKFFNTPYVHLQGLKDHFQTFVEWCQALTKNVADLETKYGVDVDLIYVAHTTARLNPTHEIDLFLLYPDQLAEKVQVLLGEHEATEPWTIPLADMVLPYVRKTASL